MYDDNILIAPSDQKLASFITPHFAEHRLPARRPDGAYSNYLNLYFSPTLFIYNDPTGLGGPKQPFQVRTRLITPPPPGTPFHPTAEGYFPQTRDFNRLDMVGDAYYQHNWTRLSVGIDENFQHLTDSTLDEGKLVSRNISNTKLTASYLYNDDLSLYATGNQNLSFYPGQAINSWSADTYALYQIAPKLLLGAGPRFTYLVIQNATDQRQEDFLARLKYTPDTKFVLSFEGGIEYLQYQDSPHAGPRAAHLRLQCDLYAVG